MKPVTAILAGAGQRGADAYGTYALRYPNEFQIVAVADPDMERRTEFQRLHGLPESMCFNSWETLLKQDKLADCALICTQDQMHYEPTVAAMKKGYHVLLEKPMSGSVAECIEIGNMAKKYNRILSICHVLRYTPFYTAIKDVIDSGKIGQPVSMQQIENVGFWHQAHSFVRGNWRNTEESNPMILAKSCHDMDIILWLMGSVCTRVSSFGGLFYFKEENAPPGAPERCLDRCPHRAGCNYYAPDIYLQNSDAWHVQVLKKVVSQDTSAEGIYEALRTGPYGRCVFRCDNDVVDHQVVSMEFANGATADFTMCAFTSNGGRSLKIMGTKGQITADMESDWIEVVPFHSKNREVIHINASGVGHGGGDEGIMQDFIALVGGHRTGKSRSSADISVQSHLIALAAEQSRITGQIVDMAAFAHETESGVSPKNCG